jgi:hypothetical protein
MMENDVGRQWSFVTPLVPGDVLAAQVRQIEAQGLAGIFVPEIYSDPFMGLGFCAAVTDRVQLATGIKIAFASNPFEIAMTAMDLDRVSGGRFVLGLGTSIKAWVEGFHGMPGYGRPVEHIKETIELIRLIVAKSHTGELDRFDGKYHTHDWSTFLGPFAPPIRDRIPIWLAANQRGLTRLAGEVADGYIDHPIHGPGWLLRYGRDALADGLARAGPATPRHPLEYLVLGGGERRPEGGAQRRPCDRRLLRRHEAVRADVRLDGLREGGPGMFGRARAQRHGGVGWRGQRRDGGDFRDPRHPGRVPETGRRGLGRSRFVLPVPTNRRPPPEKVAFYLGGIAETFYG